MPHQPPIVAKATLTALPGGTPLTVHFNPASLVYSVENSVAQQSGNPKKAQYVAQFSGKLTMDLQFDTTNDGSDVRTVTNQVALFMQASANASAAAQNSAPPSANGNSSGPPPKAPPVLMFQWGTYQFQGIMDSFKETIDFFSNDWSRPARIGQHRFVAPGSGLRRGRESLRPHRFRQSGAKFERRQRAVDGHARRRPKRGTAARRGQRP